MNAPTHIPADIVRDLRREVDDLAARTGYQYISWEYPTSGAPVVQIGAQIRPKTHWLCHLHAVMRLYQDRLLFQLAIPDIHARELALPPYRDAGIGININAPSWSNWQDVTPTDARVPNIIVSADTSDWSSATRHAVVESFRKNLQLHFSLASGRQGRSRTAVPSVLDLHRFESIGDNCEFGFVQRANGFEDGGLLRWAISPLNDLVRCLESNFSDLYGFDNLVPAADNMVRDIKTGLSFHSDMRSVEQRFILGEKQRKDIYLIEKRKIDYLRTKLIDRLDDSNTIFVYKCNAGVTDDDARRLQLALSRYSKSTLLIMATTDEVERIGIVERCHEGFYRGFVGRFAPYENASDLLLKDWNMVLHNVLTIMNGRER